ncbi:Lon protease family protein [Calderihabitans maritimus]|uniref:endopeptidase La n=1 Tax=Calderihabitans maritimus TaxID=1246530 RepID=A0A1Z5HP47_9FIRM|nr:ATP-binding protein [Calderihabitans maritimus]GAW91306.1 ATP-dependent protease [Calderihabitans maritimus]
MGTWKEVPVEKLSAYCDPAQFKFQTTEEVTPLEGMVGQERAVRAMEFGLKMKKHGYNIFMTGLTGTGKTSYALSLIQQMAKKERVPEDWCYVHNFEKPDQPVAIDLPAGMGKVFAEDMDRLVEELQVQIPKAFGGEEYDKQKAAIIKEYQGQKANLLEELSKAAEERGFVLKSTSAGYVSIPLIDGKEISQEEYNNLDEETRADIDRRSEEIQLKMLETMRKIQAVEREAKEKIKELEQNTGLFAVGHLIDELKEKYGNYPKVLSYLEAVQKDILLNLDHFRAGEEEKDSFPWLRKISKETFLTRYKVNLLVDNSEQQGAPVVMETNPTYYNLMGSIEYENEWGAAVTDFTKIKAGALHRANGGYLILQAKDVLANLMAWEALKRVLKTKEIRVENLGSQIGLVAMATLKPEPIPIQVKVVLVGHPVLYHLLYSYDEDFRKFFKIKADFDTEMPRTEENLQKMAEFVSSLCRREGLKPFDRSGVAAVVEYSCRLAEHQEKLSTRFNEIAEIIFEADAWAGLQQAEVVSRQHVKRAIKEKIYRSNKYEEKLHEMLREGQLMVDATGAVVGQVNGLSVLDLGDYSFGKPTRITATTFLGKEGVINIERETEMSGNIHDKGVMILSGYLGAKYAQEIPLTLSASLCFEQSYQEIEGDSASSAELYALLSSLAELPVKQGIAVTGSVNQKGEIQPVGGVTAKIEGFFALCKIKGLTGEQGVIIPYQNIPNLVLSDEVIEAVRQGKFHIYPVRTVDEGIAILTGVPAGEKDENGNYPPGTVNYLVQQKLQHYADIMLKMAAEVEEPSPVKNSEPK